MLQGFQGCNLNVNQLTVKVMTIAAASVAFSFTLITAKPVQAATFSWNLDFFDDNNVQVGSGEFSYDPTTTTFVETTPTSLPEGFTVQNDLETFSANIRGENWGFEAGTTWWAEPSRPPGQQRTSRSRPFVVENSWFFGDPFFGTRALNMDIDSASDTAGSGTWFQLIVPPGGGDPFRGAGTWKATLRSNVESVPESSSVLGLLAIGTFGAVSLLKRTGNQRSF